MSFIAVIGSPLLLSWDIRIPSGKSTLPLAAYLNSELIAIHQDNASSLVTHDTPYYYQRLRGGAPPGSLFAPVATGASCASSAAQFTFHPTSSSPPRGYFESVALPGCEYIYGCDNNIVLKLRCGQCVSVAVYSGSAQRHCLAFLLWPCT